MEDVQEEVAVVEAPAPRSFAEVLAVLKECLEHNFFLFYIVFLHEQYLY